MKAERFVEPEATLLRRECDLKWINVIGVRRNRNNGDDSSTDPLSYPVRSVVTDDHRWPTLVGLGTPHGLKVNHPDLTAAHQPKPSAATASQAAPSSAAHSAQAAS